MSVDKDTQINAQNIKHWGDERLFPGTTTSNDGLPAPYSTYPGWVGHLSHNLSDATTYAYDYAYIGGVVDNSITPTDAADLTTQTQWFIEDFDGNTTWTNLTDSHVVLAWFGVNDVADLFVPDPSAPAPSAMLSGSPVDAKTEANQQRVVTSYFSQLNKIYDVGARHFVVMGCPRRSPYPDLSLAMNSHVCSFQPLTRLGRPTT